MANKSLNKVELIGNLTRDPELKYTPQGTAVCSFGLATNRTWTTHTGETKEDAQFHRIVAWQKLAELAAQLLTKGRRMYLEGRIVYRSFEGKDGAQRQITEIIMSDFILLDSRIKSEVDESRTTGGEATLPEEADIDISDISLDDNVDKSSKKDEKKPEKLTLEKVEEKAKTESEDDVDDIPF